MNSFWEDHERRDALHRGRGRGLASAFGFLGQSKWEGISRRTGIHVPFLGFAELLLQVKPRFGKGSGQITNSYNTKGAKRGGKREKVSRHLPKEIRLHGGGGGKKKKKKPKKTSINTAVFLRTVGLKKYGGKDSTPTPETRGWEGRIEGGRAFLEKINTEKVEPRVKGASLSKRKRISLNDWAVPPPRPKT